MTPPIAPHEKHYLVVVADEARATVYARDSYSGPLRKLQSFANAAARMKTEELISDRGGRSFDSLGQGRHTMTSERSDPHDHLATTFAREVTDFVAHDSHRGTCRGFALIAPPRFLGLLRKEAAQRLKDEPYATIDKDVVGEPADVIEKLLARMQ